MSQVEVMMETPLEAAWEAFRARCRAVVDADAPEPGDKKALLDALDAIWLVRWSGGVTKDLVAVEAKLARATWQEIGDALRVERQVVFRKYRKVVRPAEAPR